MRILVVALLVILSSVVNAQQVIVTTDAKSAAELQSAMNRKQTMRNASLRADAAKQEWDRAVKVGKSAPKKAHTEAECLKLESLAKGDVGFIDYWPLKANTMQNGSNTISLSSGSIHGTSIRSVTFVVDRNGVSVESGDDVRVVGYVQILSRTSSSYKYHEVHLKLLTDEEAKEALRIKSIRTWTDLTGKHSFDGSFGGFKAGKVVIEAADKSVREVPIVKLSKADADWVRSELKKGKK